MKYFFEETFIEQATERTCDKFGKCLTPQICSNSLPKTNVYSEYNLSNTGGATFHRLEYTVRSK